MTIDWQATVAQLDADPDISTPAGTAVLSNLVAAGRRYDAAGKPDVMHESEQHADWSRKPASQKLGIAEPPYYVAGYYARVAPRSGSISMLNKRQFTAEELAVLPPDAIAAYRYWLKRAEQLPAERAFATSQAKQIASYYIAKAEQAKRDALSVRLPTYGRIESDLASAMSAAERWLKS